ncbi:sensor histidine kinase [Hoeflea prorocentri]|uniref:ATP-binding protein n=1 Tax=Hoeflea prorocentri TaxID=1922333 RepID=A0A9X3ZIV3_9HYPH|nr:ATP-binding protein [Hoeflea prorocentri]MCY6382125.1 ATP-binding protein [Hoeflea prorocentri]MDA5399925.1 ATP-binding protein [Hoeflea prorocentri]
MSSQRPKSLPAHPYVLGLWAVIAAVISFILAFEQLPLPDQVAPLKSMQFRQGADAVAGEVSLPDNWRSFSGRVEERGTYEAMFDFAADNGRWAVYIPNYSGRIEVNVNGIELSPGGFLSGNLIADQSVPFLAPVAGSALQASGNTLQITMVPGGKLIGFLSDVYVGPEALLRDSFEWHYLRAVRLPELIVFWQMLLALLLLVMWYSRRNDRAALFASLVLAFSSLHGIPVYLPSSVALSQTVALLGYVVNFWLSVIGLMFAFSLTDRKLPVKARYFFLLPALATVAYLTLPDGIFRYFDTVVVVPFSLMMTCWVVYVFVHSALWERRWESIMMLISVLGACTLVVHDTLIIANVTPDSNFLHFRIVYILLLPALSYIFFQRLIQSMKHVDDLVGTLEERIETKESQLRETFAQRQVLEGRQALNEERRRIMRDVHDGLGGQLMSIIAMSRLGKADPVEIETSAQAALEELRMLIGSLDVENDISGMLGTFRERAEQQLALHDISLEWQMIDIPEIEGLNPSRALNILRILQEATTNAAKHSGGDRVWIRFSLPPEPPGTLRIDIEDNGRGMANASTNGHGLKNMRSRARELGGDIHIASSEGGTKVTFSMPLTLEAGSEGQEKTITGHPPTRA